MCVSADGRGAGLGGILEIECTVAVYSMCDTGALYMTRVKRKWLSQFGDNLSNLTKNLH